MPTVKEIVTKYLQANGFGGLCNGDCGCELADLMPCDTSYLDNCKAGYKVKCDCFDEESCGFHIVTKRPVQRCEGCDE